MALSPHKLGQVALLGSGETSPSGGQVFETLAREALARAAMPLRIAVLETPAGFELNSAQVAGRVIEFLKARLQNYHPEFSLIPARRKGTPFSPDDPEITRPLLQSNVIFLGPGSPTFAVRQLENSLTWHTLIARHYMGATLVLASAATVAVGAKALPVYEIYKVGQDLHWQAGLDFFGPYGLSLVFIPHWNNTDGGAELDTSRCFMGQERFEQLMALLPSHLTVIGIDEHTALILDLHIASCRVQGAGGVTLRRADGVQRFEGGDSFSIHALGSFRIPDPQAVVPAPVWNAAQAAQAQAVPAALQPPDQVAALVEQRQAARARRDWAAADVLRDRIEALGWQVQDTLEGPRLKPGA